MRLPKHIGIIPDGNRRWANEKGMGKEKGYENGISPGYRLFKQCQQLGINELTYYGFTVDNTKRPKNQRLAFTKACVDAVEKIADDDAELLVLGNYDSNMFPAELKKYSERKTFKNGGIKINFLVNYSWEWDIKNGICSKDVSRIDLIIRWGGRKRLSGFLPIQSVYSDFYFIDDYWPDFKEEHLIDALKWYNQQEISLGG